MIAASKKSQDEYKEPSLERNESMKVGKMINLHGKGLLISHAPVAKMIPISVPRLFGLGAFFWRRGNIHYRSISK
jgi:hypothetical protein